MERMILRLPYTPQTDRREVIPSLSRPTAFAACVQLLTDSRARTNTLSDLVASASRACLARNCDVGDTTKVSNPLLFSASGSHMEGRVCSFNHTYLIRVAP